MNKPTKLLLGIITIVPLIYTVFLLIGLFQAFYSLIVPGTAEGFLFQHFNSFFIIHLLMMLWNLAQIIFYMIHVLKNDALKNERKALWAVLIFMASVFVMPVYWYLNIWRERKELSQPSGDKNGAA